MGALTGLLTVVRRIRLRIAFRGLAAGSRSPPPFGADAVLSRPFAPALSGVVRLIRAAVSMLVALLVAASAARGATISLISGNGSIGSSDPNVTVIDSCVGTQEPATIVDANPAWASPISGSQWDAPNPSTIGCNGTYQTTFMLPAGAQSPSISVSDLADNSANVSLNGNQPFITGNVPGQCVFAYGGPPASGSTSYGFVPGLNTLTFNVDNCYPAWGSQQPTGVDFVATVTYSSGPVVQITNVDPGNGTVAVSWTAATGAAAPAITGYTVTATPAQNDRVAGPMARSVSVSRPASATAATLSGLVEDCHQTYTISVTPLFAEMGGAPAVWPALVRPSGNVISGAPPPFVVVLLDGIGSQQAGFRMNPYQPTEIGPASYCPEGLDSGGRPVQRPNPDRVRDGNAFAIAPKGPYEFFEKWNYFDSYDDRKNDPASGSNSTPRNLKTRALTHSFLLDQLAATGAVILPYSYWGAKLESATRFVFNAYTNCNSNPLPLIPCNTDTDKVRMPGTSGADAGGSPDPSHGDVGNARHSFSMGEDIQRLEDELASIHHVWRHVPIIVIGHSQGGLITFDWWKRFWLSRGDSYSAGYGHTGVWKLFSLDSPINGACVYATCLNIPGYPDYTNRVNKCIPRGSVCVPNADYDNNLLDKDRRAGEPFRMIGTIGDQLTISLAPFSPDAYGPPGKENVQHELLFRYTVSCTGLPPFRQGESCTAPAPPDHISECSIDHSSHGSPAWVKKDAHFIEKFCPGNVNYLNTVLGINNLSPGGCNSTADAARLPSARLRFQRGAPRRTC